MAAGPKKSRALDTNLLLDLAGEKDFALDFKEEFSSCGYSLLVPPDGSHRAHILRFSGARTSARPRSDCLGADWHLELPAF